jgi:IPT/TIG domain
MRLITPALLLALCCFASDELAPQISTVLPRIVKPGDTVTVTGVSLGDDRVDEVYLSDHKFDMKVKVLEQDSKVIKFRVPPFAKPGRMQLLMLMKAEKEEDPKLLELPAYLLIEEISTEIGQVQAPDKGKKNTQQDQKDQKDQQKDQ